eukprot:m.199423 g.199423  ORF g.199423 m.199423 type:complete len:378 (-) comp21901_c1_seq1:25-1158(-)
MSLCPGLVLLLALAAACGCSSAATPGTADRIRGALFGALVGDALCLCSHLEYNSSRIQELYGSFDRFHSPKERTLHHGNGRGPPKGAGEQTDNGDYNLLVLEYLAAEAGGHATAQSMPPVSAPALTHQWRQRLPTWRSHISDNAQAARLGNPPPDDTMALYHAAVFAFYAEEEDVARAARAVVFTHRDERALDAAEFFARATFRVIHQQLSPSEALAQTAQSMRSALVQSQWRLAAAQAQEVANPNSPLHSTGFADELALAAMASDAADPVSASKGPHTSHALAAAIYLILRYEDDFFGGLRANAMLGGDNACRAIALGSVLGARHGVQAIPSRLRGRLAGWHHCEGVLRRAPWLEQVQREEARQGRRDTLARHREL